MKTRQIHFYSSINLITDIETKEHENFYATYEETEKAIIEKQDDVIHTTSMASFSTSLFDWNIDEIWIHDNEGEPFCIKCVNRNGLYDYEIDCDATQRILKKGHNLLKLWVAGEFSDR